MSTNLITTDVQGLEIPEGILDLFELEYNDSTTLYFHPGVDSTVRVTSISGAVVKLNRPQTFTDNAQLTFTGLDNEDGASYTVTADVNGNVGTAAYSVSVDNISNTSPSGGRTGGIAVGMIVTGSDIDDDGFGPIVFDGNTYYAMPMHMSNIEVKNDGAQNRPVLTVANAESIIRSSSVFQNADDGGTNGLGNFTIDKLVGKRITQRQTLEKYLTLDPSSVSTKAIVEYPKRTYIIDAIKQRTEMAVIFELANPFDLQGVKLPRRQIIGKYCPWAYQGLSFSPSTGACSWKPNGELAIEDDGTERKYYFYFTDLDEPIVWKYIIHNTNNTIRSGKTHPGDTSGSFAKSALVALSDGAGGYTYWRSETASNTTVPSATNSAWQQVRVYVPYVSGVTFSTNSTDTMRSDYVVHPVGNASSVIDEAFDFTSTSTVYRVTLTNNSITPATPSNYWTRGDQCGKLLNSCKIRYQAKNATGSASANQSTIPLVDLDTIQALPYGGFPGSRQI